LVEVIRDEEIGGIVIESAAAIHGEIIIWIVMIIIW